ncbi:hypothetical protein CCR94_14525 [Rhodoblastus sphagnicola]|uniref:Uncharacterized protein n=1 Tax=Rhodoblastus sphagnicola TaxID=333368 RepID=A0A2S6N5F1_9HYPH|nr:hypothetical protein CCR94_14525 [Rhodoblastus sphagnicola]
MIQILRGARDASHFSIYTFSSREPESTSLENAFELRRAKACAHEKQATPINEKEKAGADHAPAWGQ